MQQSHPHPPIPSFFTRQFGATWRGRANRAHATDEARLCVAGEIGEGGGASFHVLGRTAPTEESRGSGG